MDAVFGGGRGLGGVRSLGFGSPSKTAVHRGRHIAAWGSTGGPGDHAFVSSVVVLLAVCSLFPFSSGTLFVPAASSFASPTLHA
jgi:hypothetical protein